MISSPIPVIPVPIAPNQSKKAVLAFMFSAGVTPKTPVAVQMPMIPVETMPSSKTTITLTPVIAVPSTIR